jgi:hypothetical protein
VIEAEGFPEQAPVEGVVEDEKSFDTEGEFDGISDASDLWRTDVRAEFALLQRSSQGYVLLDGHLFGHLPTHLRHRHLWAASAHEVFDGFIYQQQGQGKGNTQQPLFQS